MCFGLLTGASPSLCCLDAQPALPGASQPRQELGGRLPGPAISIRGFGKPNFRLIPRTGAAGHPAEAESPDFRIENRLGGEAWVEAVTANPAVPYNHVNARLSSPPKTREEIFFGPAALRFAKTLGNKLMRRYDLMPHVKGKPFVIAVADFQAPASMFWSREGIYRLSLWTRRRSEGVRWATHGC